MEERNVKLTLEKAKEWYKKGGELREVALQAFSEDELKVSRSHSWEEFCEKRHRKNSGYFIGTDSIIQNSNDYCEGYFLSPIYDKNVYPTKEYAEAALALCQLLQLRQEWVGDYSPNWKNYDSDKYIIYVYNDFISVTESTLRYGALSFPTERMAKEFLVDFEDLLKIAKPLL